AHRQRRKAANGAADSGPALDRREVDDRRHRTGARGRLHRDEEFSDWWPAPEGRGQRHARQGGAEIVGLVGVRARAGVGQIACGELCEVDFTCMVRLTYWWSKVVPN